MITSLQEVADKACWMLVQRGVNPADIRRGTGISETRLKMALRRVEEGRYGDVPRFGKRCGGSHERQH